MSGFFAAILAACIGLIVYFFVCFHADEPKYFLELLKRKMLEVFKQRQKSSPFERIKDSLEQQYKTLGSEYKNEKKALIELASKMPSEVNQYNTLRRTRLQKIQQKIIRKAVKKYRRHSFAAMFILGAYFFLIVISYILIEYKIVSLNESVIGWLLVFAIFVGVFIIIFFSIINPLIIINNAAKEFLNKIIV